MAISSHNGRATTGILNMLTLASSQVRRSQGWFIALKSKSRRLSKNM